MLWVLWGSTWTQQAVGQSHGKIGTRVDFGTRARQSGYFSWNENASCIEKMQSPDSQQKSQGRRGQQITIDEHKRAICTQYFSQLGRTEHGVCDATQWRGEPEPPGEQQKGASEGARLALAGLDAARCGCDVFGGQPGGDGVKALGERLAPSGGARHVHAAEERQGRFL